MENKYSVVVVVIAAISLVATAVPVAIVAINDNDDGSDSGYVTIKLYCMSKYPGFADTIEMYEDRITEAGGKDIREVDAYGFTCKVPIDWTLDHVDEVLYHGNGDYFPKNLDGTYFDNDYSLVYEGLVGDMDYT